MRAVAIVVALVAGCAPPEDENWSSGPGNLVGYSDGTLSDAPAVWGTSVLRLADGRLAIADAESDAVYVMRQNGTQPAKLELPKQSRPFRLAEAGTRLAVTLRGSGQVALFEPGAKSVATSDLRYACAEPRGVAYDALGKSLLVACATGELVRLDDAGATTVHTGEELRDVMVVNGVVWASTFRGAELVELSPEGQVLTRLRAAPVPVRTVSFVPHVAWRTVESGGVAVMAHQLHVVDEVTKLTAPGPGAPYYGRPICGGSVVGSAFTVFDLSAKTVRMTAPIGGALPVDVAFDGTRAAVALAGSARVQVFALAGTVSCAVPAETWPAEVPMGVALTEGGNPIWFEQGGGLDDHTGTTVHLVPPRRLEPGRTLFHAASPSGVACASCHPEGFDDGHTWQFGTRRVRSQSLEGGLLETAPFHWDGRFNNLSAVLDETFVQRMGAVRPSSADVGSTSTWLEGLKARSARPDDAPAAKRGRLVFLDSGCDSCHAGAAYTNDATVDVGTGGAFQVPSLRALRWRGPWMHDGCAQTLADRFTPACGGQRHGTLVPPEQVPDLVEYLKTL